MMCMESILSQWEGEDGTINKLMTSIKYSLPL